MIKKVIVLLVVAMLAFTALAGCSSDTSGSTSSAPAESVAASAATSAGTADSAAPAESQSTAAASGSANIVWIHMSPSAQSEQRAYAGFSAYLKEKGWNWNVTEVNSDGSGDKMATNIEDAVSKGCDAIIISMGDLRASTAALKSANDANIPVFTIDSQYTAGTVCDITSNNYVMSSKVSSYMVDKLGGVGNICALTMAEHHGVRKRGEVLTDVILAENPGIKLLENHNIDYGNFLADSQKTVEDWLAKYGKEINAIWCGWDEPAMAASDAIKAAGYTRDDMFVTGIDGAEGALDDIRNGDPLIATCAQAFEIFGQKCADLVQAIIVEGKPQAEVVQTTTIYVDAPFITPSNCPDENTPAYLATDFYQS